MSILFNRVAAVTIGDRLFRSPPFSIDFDINFKGSGSSTVKAKLYNPSKETIESCEPSRIGTRKQFPILAIEAGYKDNFGPVFLGEVFKFSSEKKGTDRVLTVEGSDGGHLWNRALVNQSYRKMRVSSIVTAMASVVGVQVGRVRPKNDVMVEVFTAQLFKIAISNLAKMSESRYYYKAGKLHFESLSDSLVKDAIVLSTSTGLIEKPMKTSTGYKLKSLFMYEIDNGSYIVLEDEGVTIKVFQGKHSFKTHGKSGTECEGVKV